jgi:ribosomal protein S18 acetylase RimI-like enzyme
LNGDRRASGKAPGLIRWVAMDGQDVPVTIRSFRPSDLPACRVLYREGLLGGKLAENDTGLDIDDIESAYMKPGNHFWVAETADGKVVGMIGVQHHDEGVGEIRRLRVAQDLRRRGIGTKLMETAVKFCHDHQYLKVTLDTFVEREAAVKLFEKFRFHHGRTRNVAGKELMYFYIDLYTGDQPPRRQPQAHHHEQPHGQA